MAVTYQPPIRVDQLTQRLRFTSDQATPVSFRAYREGRLLAAWTSPDGAGVLDIVVPVGESPFIEVLDRDAQSPSLAFPGRFTIQWDSVIATSPDVSRYRIDKYVVDTWVEQDVIYETGQVTYWWQSSWLADVTEHQFRVVPIDLAGNEADTPLEFTVMQVRHPDTPSVTYEYDGAGTPTVTISEA